MFFHGNQRTTTLDADYLWQDFLFCDMIAEKAIKHYVNNNGLIDKTGVMLC